MLLWLFKRRIKIKIEYDYSSLSNDEFRAMLLDGVHIESPKYRMQWECHICSGPCYLDSDYTCTWAWTTYSKWMFCSKQCMENGLKSDYLINRGFFMSIGSRASAWVVDVKSRFTKCIDSICEKTEAYAKKEENLLHQDEIDLMIEKEKLNNLTKKD